MYRKRMTLNGKTKASSFGLLIILLATFFSGVSQTKVQLGNRKVKMEWAKTDSGYRLKSLVLIGKKGNLIVPNPFGEYTVLYANEAALKMPVNVDSAQWGRLKAYQHMLNGWKIATGPVPMNTAGKALTFYPATAKEVGSKLIFGRELPELDMEATWQLDPAFAGDVLVEVQMKAKVAGYYSIASPSVYAIPRANLEWAMLPGYFQGKSLNPDLMLSYGYGEGIPDRPVVVRERTASTLAPLIQNKDRVTLAVIPAPGTGRDPWAADKSTQSEWDLGLSLMNRKGQLTPTVYHPVLGEKGSYMNAGEERTFRFRYSLGTDEWFSVFKHAVYDVYQFKHFLDLKDTHESLTKRIYAMIDYVRNDSTSKWHTYNYQGLKIGAQSYLGWVVGSDKDAMKNSDYGAMWMLANATHDSTLKNGRLPFARNFKLTQQQAEDGFFKGAAVGQYYLWKSKRFTEEWGNYVEPIAITYYTMLDIGNILLFNPDDQALRERLRWGADKLMEWQKADGSWVVAYDRNTTQQVFTELKDRRPTFYGLLVAYRLLGDQKYLDAAKKGADWFLKEAVDKGNFLGVCGDTRFAPDFATGQSAQALMDLYDVTKNNAYLKAAIRVARIYTASVYTHPIPTTQEKSVKGKHWADWQISQVGLSFEHGGLLGSANGAGPILLASHAGMFVRMFGETKDSIFLDMARAAAWGRDAFVDPASHVASYYWSAMNNGPGEFPHHAWWQIGWITDYLMSEAAMRSDNRILFPRGFITPKVGPHQPYGFQSGDVFGTKADLIFPENAISVNNERLDFVGAKTRDEKCYFVIVMNNSTTQQKGKVSVDLNALVKAGAKLTKGELLDHTGRSLRLLEAAGGNWDITIPAYGMYTLKFKGQ
ncbi:Beta-L-arabinofuranosidase, GH127 [bacterium A37T11]|nr:Beta-L-arabinofuranosidase, GH127 [bacterium A37T11]